MSISYNAYKYDCDQRYLISVTDHGIYILLEESNVFLPYLLETFVLASYINIIEKASLLIIYLGEVIDAPASLIGSFLRQASYDSIDYSCIILSLFFRTVKGPGYL